MKRLLLGLLAALSLFLAPVGASASPESSPSTESSRSSAPSVVNVVHGIPGADDFPVDIYVDGALALPGVTFGAVAAGVELPAGPHQIDIRVAGADAASAPALAANLNFRAGRNYSVIAHLSETGAPRLSRISNNVRPGLGEARVSVRHLAAAPTVDVLVNGDETFTISNARRQRVAGADLPAATYSVSVVAAADNSIVALPPTDLALAANTLTVVYAVGDFGNGSFTPIVQTIDLDAGPDISSGPGTVNVVHGIPGADDFPVDVYVDDALALPGVTFGAVAAGIDLPAGRRTIAIRPAGADASSAPAIQKKLVIGSNINYSITAFLNADGAPRINRVRNDIRALDGEARVIVRHLALAPTVDVLVNGAETFTLTNAPGHRQGKAVVPAGTYSVSVVADADNSIVALPATDLAFAADTVTVVYAVGDFANGSFTPIVQVIPAG